VTLQGRDLAADEFLYQVKFINKYKVVSELRLGEERLGHLKLSCFSPILQVIDDETESQIYTLFFS
jgi:hypothetical protein